MKLIGENGYLAAITPPGWMSPGNNIDDTYEEIFSKKQIIHLDINTIKMRFKSVGSMFTWFLIQNRPKTDKTLVRCYYKGKLYEDTLMIEGEYLPLLLTDRSLSIMKKMVIEGKIEFVNRHDFDNRRPFLSKEKDSKHPFDVAYTKTHPKFSSKKQDIHNKKKIIVFRSGNLNPFYDEGDMSVADQAMYVLVSSEKEGSFIIDLLNSKLYRFIIDICKYSGFHHPKVLQNLPYPKDLKHNFTDKDLYNYFKLTKDEIKLIEENVK